jgi:hypothetical protein
MDFDVSVRVRRPPDAVFAMLADIQDYVDPDSPVPEMEKIPVGPTKVGTRWREVVRLAPHFTMTMWSEVSGAEPGRRLDETFRGPWITGVLSYTIEPTDVGSLLRQRETLTPRGPLRLMAGPMERMLRPRIVQRLESIRDRLEAESATVRG